jgi:predicted PurR-regulated permease PerM
LPTQRERVPVRTIAVTIGMVLATAAILLLGWEVRRVLTWIVVAALLSIILGPFTDLVERRLHLRRSLATLLVFLFGLVLLAGIVTVFVRPIAKEGPSSSTAPPPTSPRPRPAAARSAGLSSATTSPSGSPATRHGCARPEPG